MKPDEAIDRLLAEVEGDGPQPLYLVQGEPIVAVPAAERLAEGLAERLGCPVERHQRPEDLGPLLADLKTYSLFSSAKLILAVESVVLADRAAAAQLVEEAAKVLPLAGGADAELTDRERRAARTLLRVLELFGLDPDRPGASLSQLPDSAFKGTGKRARGPKQIERLRDGLGPLLEAAVAQGLESYSDSLQAELGAALDDGFPEAHVLVLCESAVAAEHPLVARLEKRRAAVRLGEIAADKRGWTGLDEVVRQLSDETGASIAREALQELVRRTLRQSRGRGAARTGGQADAETTARLAAEYRKLAMMSGGERIEAELVRETVEDRGAEDVWGVLDAIGDGKAALALERIDRLMATGGDTIGTRLGIFSALAEYCRHLTAIGGLLDLRRLPRGVSSYNRFKAKIAPALQEDLADGSKSPLAGIHPFRLFRAYGAASRLGPTGKLPAAVLATELQLKGESDDPDAALARFVTSLARAGT